ncbi:hypothetical protein NLX71_13655 [Paenibacillus sp. MZ04-78.2]|uniref:hypothetical protein n=1 Tax=Paenibacillus sp. MZ04-78.2 TaxID=2962034 RepID=UPI0020B7A242|nr:hypothetical protein [Paenibacillus sp. MZ04-78.2]MCP3774343.1 hypothetical protein [Paenibacillus sp. MZ04-78.2]
MEANQSHYEYAGSKFNEYTKLKIFKSSVEEKIKYFGEEDNFVDYYENLITKYRGDKATIKKINEVFFEHIVYGRLTNIYLYNTKTSKVSKEIFYKRVETLIDEFKVNLTNSIHHLLNKKGFYLMDSINVSKPGANFIAAYDCQEHGEEISGARFLFGRNVFRKKSDQVKTEYLLGAVEINFINKTFIIYTKNPVGLSNDLENDEDDLDENNKYSVFNFHNYLKEKVSLLLGITLEETSSANDQKGMYKFCKNLFDILMDDSKKLVFENTNDLIKRNVKQLTRKLGEIGTAPTHNEISNLEKKLEALLLGVYVSTNMDEKTLRLKARELSLIGYPTKINYKNSRTNRSSTGTSTAKRPIASSDTLYSLLTDFENTKKLDKWSMSWFFDLDDDEDDDVIQTTIEAKKHYLKVTLLATRHHNKEIIHHVIRNINNYRGN